MHCSTGGDTGPPTPGGTTLNILNLVTPETSIWDLLHPGVPCLSIQEIHRLVFLSPPSLNSLTSPCHSPTLELQYPGNDDNGDHIHEDAIVITHKDPRPFDLVPPLSPSNVLGIYFANGPQDLTLSQLACFLIQPCDKTSHESQMRPNSKFPEFGQVMHVNC